MGHPWNACIGLFLFVFIVLYALIAVSFVLIVNSDTNISEVRKETRPVVVKISNQNKREKDTPKDRIQVSSDRCDSFHRHLQTTKSIRTTRADWEKCGREPNQVLEWEDGGFACVRHRYPHEHLIAGDILTFHASTLLGLSNIPCAVLVPWQIPGQPHGGLTSFAVVSEWVPNLKRTPLPSAMTDLLNDYAFDIKDGLWLSPVDQRFAEMLVFDYVTGHYDRLASIQDDCAQRRTPITHRRLLRNVGIQTDTNQLWLFDNEAGMLDGYALLYEQTPRGDNKRFTVGQRMSEVNKVVQFHNIALNISVCSIGPSMQSHLQSWASHDNPLKLLLDTVARKESSTWAQLEHVLWSNSTLAMQLVHANFNQRLRDVVQRRKLCTK